MKELLKKKGFLFDVEGVLTDNIDEGHGLSNTANFISLLKMLFEYITIFCRTLKGAEVPFDREYLHKLQFC